jgi:hypothetical protein
VFIGIDGFVSCWLLGRHCDLCHRHFFLGLFHSKNI